MAFNGNAFHHHQVLKTEGVSKCYMMAFNRIAFHHHHQVLKTEGLSKCYMMAFNGTRKNKTVQAGKYNSRGAR
jgi:hypothetical protein